MRTGTDTERLTLPSIDGVSIQSWERLAQKRIFFGHQSVGYNVVEGICDVVNGRGGIRLRIAETRGPAEFVEPVFGHAKVGRNTDPFSKIDAFRNIIDGGIGEVVDIAFFKFCYVDVVAGSEPQEIFDRYGNVMGDLKRRYPGVKFLHVTVPIVSAPKGTGNGLRESFKSLVGRPCTLADNMVRERYNKLMCDEYCQEEPFFDLAFVESVNSNGLRCYIGGDARKVPVMAPEYTEDGGHLNRLGRKRAAEQLLAALARTADGI